ncbi:NfeD family protein [Haliangium sp.]|uniref:NfeD family protein n=1 Tax=Haliangium sp. TaxID=2663208 RepID=UPI003D119C38
MAADATEPTPPGPMALPADLPARARFMVAELHDEVSLGMAAFVERLVDGLEAGDVLLLDINTFGGRVDAAVRIRDALLSARQRQAHTVAYVHPRAISAGALISLAADVIVVAPGATMGAATPVTMQGGKMEPVEEKTVSYMRQEMRATAEARGRRGDIAEAMVDADNEVPGLIGAGKLLTLDGTQALAWGVASLEAETLDEAVAGLGYTVVSDAAAAPVGPSGPGEATARTATITRAQWNWAELLAGLLTSALLSGLLMSIGMLGIMIGLYTGGSPVPLVVGGLCLALFFLGHHVVALAGLEEVLLFGVGVALIAVEVFAPGHIVPGVVGVLFVLASLAMGLVDFEHVPFSVQWEAGWVTRALAVVCGAIAFTAALGVAAFRVLPETRFGRGLVLETAVTGRATDSAKAHNSIAVGKSGTALTDLRPGGKVEVEGHRYDALAAHGFIAAGTAVEVRRTRGFSLIVAAKAPADAQESA